MRISTCSGLPPDLADYRISIYTPAGLLIAVKHQTYALVIQTGKRSFHRINRHRQQPSGQKT